MPENGRKTEATMTENVVMNYGKKYLEKVGGEWKTTARDRTRCWRLLNENVGKEKLGKEKQKRRKRQR